MKVFPSSIQPVLVVVACTCAVLVLSTVAAAGQEEAPHLGEQLLDLLNLVVATITGLLTAGMELIKRLIGKVDAGWARLWTGILKPIQPIIVSALSVLVPILGLDISTVEVLVTAPLSFIVALTVRELLAKKDDPQPAFR
jgi:hypothetical protein